MKPSARRLALLLTLCGAALAVAIPVVAAPPSTPPGQADKPSKSPETPVTVEGTVKVSTDSSGARTYTLTAGGKTWTLSAGPSWFWGDKNPLEASVGKSVAIAGSARQGETELDVETIDGTAIREAGRPAWAGGPWTVGESHPGWKDWMAEGKPGAGKGRQDAPGQQKKEDETP